MVGAALFYEHTLVTADDLSKINAAFFTTNGFISMLVLLAVMIVRDIVSRNRGPGDTLPSEAAMLAHYRVSRASLREALRLLEVQELIRLKPGPGGGPIKTKQVTEPLKDLTPEELDFVEGMVRRRIEARRVAREAADKFDAGEEAAQMPRRRP